MNAMNAMNGINPGNAVGSAMAGMKNAPNGATPRPVPDQHLDAEYKVKLNTFIYDYFLRNEDWGSAAAIYDSPNMTVNTKQGTGRPPNPNGNMDTDIKNENDPRKGLPLPQDDGGSTENSFLLDWFTLFWDIFFAPRGRNGKNPHAVQYMDHSRQQSNMRQQAQQQFLQGGRGMMPGNMPQNYMMRMNGGMPMNANETRQQAIRNNMSNMRNMTQQQQQQLLRNQQMMAQQQTMERAGSEVDMNGQRPRTPSSGDNAPSPSKRPRLDNGQFPQQMMANGRFPPGVPNQHMMGDAMGGAAALLRENNINPNYLSQNQLQTFQNQNPQVQKKTLDVYSQSLVQQHRQSMPQGGMPNQPGMLQPGSMEGMEFYANNQMRPQMPQAANGAGGNHALQDYQMQLMLLEQQNKKRLLMARQEQDNIRPEGGQQMAPGQPGNFGAQGMSPSGSRSGPSPNPSDQMRKGTPKMGQAGLPGSPMPDGQMHGRGSPGAMNFDANMNMNMLQNMKGMGVDGGMPMGPNANGMRPPSSHPNFNGQAGGPQAMDAAMRARAAQGGGMPNGANWQAGPQGQAPMVNQGNQQQQQPGQQGQQQMGTPQQRNATMPPPQNVPAGGNANGRPASPAQSAPSSTPQQSNKPNPKGKKDGDKPRKRTQKKASTNATAATPSADAENPPATPSTPMHAKSFNEAKNNPNPASNAQAVAPIQAPAAPVAQPQPDPGVVQFPDMGEHNLGMDFGTMESGDVLEQFDFDAFLQGDGDDFLNGDPVPFGNYDGLEAGVSDV